MSIYPIVDRDILRLIGFEWEWTGSIPTVEIMEVRNIKAKHTGRAKWLPPELMV